MKYKQTLFLLFFIPFVFASSLSAFMTISKPILEGKVLQTQKYGSQLTIKFLPPSIKSFDGDISFHFSSNPKGDNEIHSYKLIDGKMIYYGYDGSKHRLTLLSAKSSTWIILEEADMDGDDKQFGFGKGERVVYTVVRSRSSTAVTQKTRSVPYTHSSSQQVSEKEMIDQLYMQIYGRLDTRIASRRDYIEEINNFIYTASLLLIKKHKLNIKMNEIRQHQMAAIESPPEVTYITNALSSIENLDGRSIIDHEGNQKNTISQLKQAYGKAIKKSMQFQRDNYSSEKERKSDLGRLEKLLARAGSAEQKNDMKDAETQQLKGSYRYYKKLLDNSSVWCMTDRDLSQKKPLFYPKTFIIERLYQKYEAELSRTHDSYDPRELSQRAKKIEEKSQKIKYQFRGKI